MNFLHYKRVITEKVVLGLSYRVHYNRLAIGRRSKCVEKSINKDGLFSKFSLFEYEIIWSIKGFGKYCLNP